MKCKIYALSSNDEPFNYRYIGLTSQKLYKRLSGHIARAKKNKSKNNLHVYNWINSLISKNRKPIIILLEDNISKNKIFNREKYWIKHFNDLDYNLTNLTNGGEGCFGYKHTLESRKKISNSLLGKPSWNSGKTDLPKASEKTKRKRSKSMLSYYRSSGLKNSNAKKVYQYNYNDGKLIKIWDSISSISPSVSSIRDNCNLKRNKNGRIIAFGGYIWSFVKISNLETYISDNHIIKKNYKLRYPI